MSDYNPTDLLSQENQKAETQAERRIQQSNEDEDWKWLMGGPKGRRIVWRLLEDAGVFQSSFNQNASLMAFKEGNRNYGLRVIAKLMVLCPAQYATMTEENTRKDVGTGPKSH